METTTTRATYDLRDLMDEHLAISNEVVTDIEQVIDLNNCLFAPIWAELSEIGETIPMASSSTRDIYDGWLPRSI
jgi:hypothetical protein